MSLQNLLERYVFVLITGFVFYFVIITENPITMIVRGTFAFIMLALILTNFTNSKN